MKIFTTQTNTNEADYFPEMLCGAGYQLHSRKTRVTTGDASTDVIKQCDFDLHTTVLCCVTLCGVQGNSQIETSFL